MLTQTFIIVVDTNTPANTLISKRFRMDNRASKLRRLKFYAKDQSEQNGGLGVGVDYEISIKDDQELHKGFTLWKDYYCTPTVPYELRGVPFDITAQGRDLTIEVKVLATTTQAGILYFVADLDKPKQTTKNSIDAFVPTPAPTTPAK